MKLTGLEVKTGPFYLFKQIEGTHFALKILKLHNHFVKTTETLEARLRNIREFLRQAGVRFFPVHCHFIRNETIKAGIEILIRPPECASYIRTKQSARLSTSMFSCTQQVLNDKKKYEIVLYYDV